MAETLHTEEAHLLGPNSSFAPRGYGSQSTDNLPGMSPTDNPARTFRQYAAALSASGGALAAGVLLGWTSPTEPRLVKDKEYNFDISAEDFSWVGASMTLGAATVCIPIGFFMNWIGRKLAMLLLVLPFTLGWALLIWAQNVAMMYCARYILGIAGGAFCITAPTYIGEIASKEIRGTLGTFFQLMITIGILLAYLLGWKLSVFVFSIVAGIIPLIFGAVFIFFPESPTYLVSKGKNDQAIKAIQWLRGEDYDYTEEMADLQRENEKRKASNVSIRQAIMQKSAMKVLIIGVGLSFFQQLSGINAVIFYTNKIFGLANTGIDDSVAAIIVGAIQVVATIVSSLVVDKAGRRILLMASSSIMAICTIFMGVYFQILSGGDTSVNNFGWLPIVCLCVFIIMFSLGFGPVPWLMLGELFPPDIKAVGAPICGTVNWLLAFIVTKTFENLLQSMGPGPTFWFFSALSLLGTAFVYFFVPETKGKSLSEIQQILRGEKITTTSQ